MREIGIRELKATLSETLRDVGAGERIRVTSRGKPIADLVPPEPTDAEKQMAQMVAEGRLTLPTKPWPPREWPLIKADRSASDFIREDRDSER